MKKYFYLFAFLVVGLTNIFAQTAPTSANNAVPGIEDTYLTVFSGDFTFNDVDPGDALASVLIEAVPTNGILFNDALVTDNGVYDVGEELVIGSVVSIADIVASQLMFLPNLDFNGADSFQFEVNDDSGVPPDQSTGNYIMTLNIAAVNDAPVAANNTITTSEDSPLVIVEANLGYSDVDADLMNYAEIVTLPALGTLFYDANNNAVVDGGDHIYAIGDHITPADFGTNFVRYSPPTDANGSPYTSFTFRVHDGTTLSVAANTMTINVVAVNDAPIAANNTVTTNKNIDKVFAAIDFGYSDVDADALSLVRVTAIPGVGTLYNDANLDGVVDGGETLINGNTVSLAQINASQLKFRPVPNANGIPYTTFTFDVNDGNVYSAATYTMTINVTNVNNAPTAANNTVTTAEDVDKVFAAVDFNYSDVDADAMTLVRVTAIPLAGTLYNDANLDGLVDVGETLINGNTVSLAQINAGQLKFRPVPNANGTPYTTFTFDVNDGTAYSDGTYTMTINVTSVNDAPTAANNTLTGTEDTDYTFAAGDFGYSDIDADAMSLVRVTVIPAVGTLYNDADLDGLVDVGETLINGNTVSLAQINAGQLKFRTVPNANGIPYTTFTFDVNDGTEYSASTYTMTINVTPVNDAPVLAAIEGTALTYVWNSTPVAITSTVTATDIDDTNLEGATINIGAGLVPADDVLSFTPANGITVLSWTPATGTLVLTGTSSVANYQAALRSVTYSNTNAAATFGGRTILFKVSDGTDESAQVSRVVNVVLPPPTLSSVSLPTQANNSVGVSIVPTIRWYSVWGAASYTVELSDDPTFATTILDTTIIHTGHPAFHSYKFHYNERLSNSTLYYWRVKANHANALYSSSFSGSWNIITITPANPYLTHPVNGAILSGNTTSFYWYSGQVGVKYLFYISSDPAFPGGGATIFADTTTNNTITVNNSLFTQGATYYWMVIAKTITVGVPGVVIDYSNPWQFSMPGLPQVVGYYPTGGVTIYNNPPTLYWYSLGYNPKVTEYIVRYRRAGSAMLGPVYGGNSLSNTQGIFSTTNINTFSAIPFALDGGYQYFWQVASRDGGTALDNTSYSPEESFFVYGNPTFIVCYPTYPSGGATTYTATPTFYWYPSVYSPVMYYQLQINEDATFTNAAEVTQTAIPTSSYTITGGQASALTAGTTYYWRVRGSLDGTNWGSWSTGASFVHSSTTTAASIATPYPVSPTSGTVVGVTNPTLTWSVYSADPLQFMVTWATNPAFTGDTFTSEVDHSGWMSSNSFVLNGLTAGATYYWQVKARLATTLVEGAWSTVAWFTTAAGSASVVPVAGSPVNGTPINSTTAVLSWLLPTKSTSALKYDVQYSKTADFSNAQAIRSLEKENIEIKNLDKNSVYYWRVSSTTNSGLTSNYSAPTSFNTGKNVTAVEEEVVIPTKFSLEQNYPNPFNPTTLISYALPSNSFVTLKVYDMLGREIKTLVSKEVAAGSYSVNWNGDDNFGNKVSTGAYVYRITAGDFVSVKKMLLIK